MLGACWHGQPVITGIRFGDEGAPDKSFHFNGGDEPAAAVEGGRLP